MAVDYPEDCQRIFMCGLFAFFKAEEKFKLTSVRLNFWNWFQMTRVYWIFNIQIWLKIESCLRSIKNGMMNDALISILGSHASDFTVIRTKNLTSKSIDTQVFRSLKLRKHLERCTMSKKIVKGLTYFWFRHRFLS